MADDVWHVGDSPKAKSTPAEKAAAVNQFRQWSDDEDSVKDKVNAIFRDRRHD